MNYKEEKVMKKCRECEKELTRVRLVLGGIEFPLCTSCFFALMSLASSVFAEGLDD